MYTKIAVKVEMGIGLPSFEGASPTPCHPEAHSLMALNYRFCADTMVDRTDLRVWRLYVTRQCQLSSLGYLYNSLSNTVKAK
jgi:hypothetical protein